MNSHRKMLTFITLLMMCVSLMAGCGKKQIQNQKAVPSTSIAAVKTPVYPKSISFNDYDNQMKTRNENQLDKNFIKSLDDFTYATSSRLLSDSSRNISYSPASLYMALSIAGTGAKNTTQDEIFSVLGTRGKGIDYISDQNKKLFNLLYSDNEIEKIKIANSVWLQKNRAFKKAFIDNTVNNFYASIFNIDFGDKSSSKLLSNWISENTNGVLSPQISTDKNQIMTILNTIYYKNEWTDKFDENNTKPDNFYPSDGSNVQCDFMNNTYIIHGFIKGEGFTASYLDLKNGDNMVFVLPDKGLSVKDLLSTPQKAASLFQFENMKSGKVIFQIPKFSCGNSLDLNDTLKDMGIKSAFEKNADFSGITDGIAFISNIKQQTHIAINEDGVEAAAFTKIDYEGSAMPKNEIAEMILNRPFIYAIESSNSRILFIGVVNNPA